MGKGVTLSELLIALAILGVIATFTIPKVLQGQQDGKHKAAAKEVIGAISQAYDIYKREKGATSLTTIADLTPYLNYVKVHTVAIDNYYNSAGATRPCNTAWSQCLLLHNGAILDYDSVTYFNGTAANSGLSVRIDPDGILSSSNTGPGRALWLFLYFNGRITDRDNCVPGTNNSDGSGGPYNPTTGTTPPWFSWD